MKKLLTIIFVLTYFIGNAQVQPEEVDYYQSIYGMAKKEVVAEMISLDAAQEPAFWTIYDTYEVSRKELGQERVVLLELYADNYKTMQPDQLRTLIDSSIELSGKTEKLIKTYYKKIDKEVSPEAAAQFFQIESYLLSKIRVQVLGNIPMFQVSK